jgi:hypothetical protein
MRDAAECLDEPLLAEVQVDGWARAFKLIEDRWKGPGLTHERYITEIMACTFGYTV